ncbi:MAG: hypothetical protein ABH865_00195 [Candidatus Omnitrophota bacterium]|nr:hypothetical protein [Candidatus Omnitrophota bacterium]
MKSGDEQLLREKIESLAGEQALELIEYKFFSHRGNYTVRCLVDFPAGGVTVDDCSRLNRKIVGMLEETGALGDDFNVEVNSPGIDRPIITYKDFLRSKGKSICLWLKDACEKKTYWEGVIVEVSSNHIGLMAQDSLLHIELSNIKLGKEKIDL